MDETEARNAFERWMKTDQGYFDWCFERKKKDPEYYKRWKFQAFWYVWKGCWKYLKGESSCTN